MHGTNPEEWQHSHDFLGTSHDRNERQTRLVIALTATMMIAEIAAGSIFNSMALLADGWHMASHASALSITALAYRFARKHRANSTFSFGTWKVSVLGGYSSAVVLGLVAILIAWESANRFFDPLEIAFDQAIGVAVVGLAVNVLSAWLLRDGHHHGDHSHHGHAHDHNLRAAYLHVLADAVTSLTAIFALLCGKVYGWAWMDPAMGVVGSIVIARWAYALLRDTSAVLLDADVPEETVDEIRSTLSNGTGDLVSDLHVWRVGPRRLAVVAAIVSDEPQPPERYKELLESAFPALHVTVEVNRCSGHHGEAA